jgi:multiple antibiotic resistance protein
MIQLYTSEFIKFFFLLTPFFLLSTFLSLTKEFEIRSKRIIAIKTTGATMLICLILFFAGNQIFSVFGITLDSFRVGTGILLFLSAVSLVQGREDSAKPAHSEVIAVVPLAIPVTVGPATTGALLVAGAELTGFVEKVTAVVAIMSAIFLIGILLLLSGYVEKIIKQQGLAILSRITGLVLAALGAQMILTGVKNFLY